MNQFSSFCWQTRINELNSLEPIELLFKRHLRYEPIIQLNKPTPAIWRFRLANLSKLLVLLLQPRYLLFCEPLHSLFPVFSPEDPLEEGLALKQQVVFPAGLEGVVQGFLRHLPVRGQFRVGQHEKVAEVYQVGLGCRALNVPVTLLQLGIVWYRAG